MKLFRSIKSAIASLIGLGVFGFKISVGVLVFYGIVRFLDSSVWDELLLRGFQQLAFIDNLEPAVNIVGGFFIISWVLRFLDQAIPKFGFSNRWGLEAKGPFRLSRFITSSLVHRDYNHLQSNTWPLLLFMGLAILLLPTVWTFLLATAVLLIIHGLGIWQAGKSGSHLGASGIVLGYYSFDVFYSMFVLRNWGGVILAVILILWRGRFVYANLFRLDDKTSVAGHAFGFIGGIFAAAVMPYLNL